MKCPFCSTDNGALANFCNSCGSPLHLKVCAACQTVNERTALVCASCARTLPETPSPDAATNVANELPTTEDTRVLVEETRHFKDLFASLEKEVDEQLSEAKTLLAAAPVEELPANEQQRNELPPGEPLVPPLTVTLSPSPPLPSPPLLTSSRTTTARPGRWAIAVVPLMLVTALVAYWLWAGNRGPWTPLRDQAPIVVRDAAVARSPAQGQPVAPPGAVTATDAPTSPPPDAQTPALPGPAIDIPLSVGETPEAPQETVKTCPEAVDALGLCPPTDGPQGNDR